MSAVTGIVLELLAIFVLAFAVRLLVERVEALSYSVTLVLVGLAVAVLGIDFAIDLSHDLIMVVLLPTLLFQGAVELELDPLEEIPLVPVVLVVVGVPVGVLVLGWIGPVAFGFPLLVSLLFAAIIVPTDPAAVLAVFEEMDAPERLSVMVDSESLFNDGVAIVVFGSLLGLVLESRQAGGGLDGLDVSAVLGGLVLDLLVVGGGGLLVGAAVGYVAHYVTRWVEDGMATVLFTLLVAYGSFLLSEHYLHLSGVLAAVGAGLLMGRRGEEFTERREDIEFVRHVWDTAAFLVSTVLYLLIGAEVRVAHFVEYAPLVALATVLVVAVRAVVVYPLLGLLNRATDEHVPVNYQHLVVWGGLHTVVPVALVLSLPADVPHREELRTMVFGVAIVGTVVQGLLLPWVLRMTGVGDGA